MRHTRKPVSIQYNLIFNLKSRALSFAIQLLNNLHMPVNGYAVHKLHNFHSNNNTLEAKCFCTKYTYRTILTETSFNIQFDGIITRAVTENCAFFSAHSAASAVPYRWSFLTIAYHLSTTMSIWNAHHPYRIHWMNKRPTDRVFCWINRNSLSGFTLNKSMMTTLRRSFSKMS